MVKWRLFLDDCRFPPDDGNDNWIIARNAEDAMFYVSQFGLPNYISFDHDLACYETGYDFAKDFIQYIEQNNLALPKGFDFYVHSQNPIGKSRIEAVIKEFLNSLMD